MTSFLYKVDEKIDTAKINLILLLLLLRQETWKICLKASPRVAFCKITSLFYLKTLSSSKISS